MSSAQTRICLLAAMLLTTGLSRGQEANKSIKTTKNKEAKMSAQKNEEVIRALYERSLNKKNFDLLKDLVSEDYTGPLGAKGVEGFERPLVGIIQAFPDIQWQIQDLFGENEKVAVRWKWQGTSTTQFVNFLPTGKMVTNEGMAIFIVKNGKITGAQIQTDRLGFYQEMGALPEDLTTISNKPPSDDRISLIDKFLIPPTAKSEFYKRMHINRDFIKTLPGFIRDDAYEYTDGDGNLIVITIAQWQNKEAIDKARAAVQAEYKKEGFDTQEMVKRLNIKMERGIYTAVNN